MLEVEKYLHFEERKQDVLSVDLAHMKTIDESEVPIIATREQDRINISWWKNNSSGWKHKVIPYSGELAAMGNSQRIGMAIADDAVFIVFKEPGGIRRLQVQIYLWNKATQELSLPQNSDALSIPILSYPRFEHNFYLWAGFDSVSDELLILSQITESDEAKLVLFKAKKADLLKGDADESIWTEKVIGEGGYELDAKFKDGVLTVVFREDTYVISVEDTDPLMALDRSQRIPFDSVPNFKINPPLTLVTVNTQSMNILSTIKDIPGGAHPQIQNLDPLYLTCDTVIDGELQLTIRGTRRRFRFARLMADKKLIRHMGQGVFKEVSLFPVSWSYFPGFIRREEEQIVRSARDGKLRIMMRHPFTPVYTCKFEGNFDKGLETLHMLHHSQKDGSVNNSKITIFVQPDWLEIREYVFQILDINHDPIPDPRLIEPFAYENEQFEPFSYESNELSDLLVTDEGRAIFKANNTLGSCLAIDPDFPSLSRYAYTDAGDGGCRVIWHEGVSLSIPKIPVELKSLSPEVVVGSQALGHEWIEINHPIEAWLPSSVPGYSSYNMAHESGDDTVENNAFSTMLSGLDGMLEALFGLAKDGFQDGLPFESDGVSILINQRRANNLSSYVSNMDVWGELWASTAEIEGVKIGQNNKLFEKISSIEIAFSRYKLQYSFDDEGDRKEVLITNAQAYNTDMQFKSKSRGQGVIRYRHLMTIDVGSIVPTRFLEFFLRINGLKLHLYQVRDFTPAILTSDQRLYSTLIEKLEDKTLETTRFPNTNAGKPSASAALSARPIKSAQIDIKEVSVDLEIKILFRGGLSILISSLILLGLTALATGLTAIVAIGVTLPVAIIAWLALSAIFYSVLPGLLKAAINGAIRSQVQNSERLKSINLCVYSGEAIGESIARMVLRQANIPLDIEGADGRNRHRGDLWQTIYVSEGRCKVLIKP